MRVTSLIAAIVLFGGGAAGQSNQASVQAKAVSCSTCHVQEATAQPATPMGRALLIPGANTTLQLHPKLTVRRGPFTYEVNTVGDQSTYTVSNATEKITVPIRWGFGANAQTFVLERNGRLVESMVSYYPEIDGLDVTIGDQSLSPHTLEEAVGRPLASSESTACFGCHSTNTVTKGKLNLHDLKPGVTCEHCHANTAAHLGSMTNLSKRANLNRGSAKAVPVIPARLSSLSTESLSTFCGQCHRSWETVVRNGWSGEINVRFQPYRLASSKCFDGADKRISCVACHNPHQDVIRNSESYDSKCLACHASGTPIHKISFDKTAAKACPVAQTHCVSCHMPKVALPGGHQTFTDHNIRVVKPGEPYPN